MSRLHLFLALLLHVHFTLSGGERVEVVKPILQELKITSTDKDEAIRTYDPVLLRDENVLNRQPSQTPARKGIKSDQRNVHERITKGAVFPPEEPIDGNLGLQGEHITDSGFIFNAKRINRNAGEYLFDGAEAFKHFQNRPYDDILLDGVQNPALQETQTILPSLFNSYPLNPIFGNLKLPFETPDIFKTAQLWTDTRSDLFAPEINPGQVLPPHNGPNTPIFLIQHPKTFIQPTGGVDILTGPDYIKFHDALNEIIAIDKNFDADSLLKSPNIRVALNSLKHLLGNNFKVLNYNKLNRLLNLIIKTYHENSLPILKEPSTWYILYLLSTRSSEFHDSTINYNKIFGTLNDLINDRGFHPEDVFRNPYLSSIINDSRGSLNKLELKMEQNYKMLQSSMAYHLDNTGLDIEAILNHPVVWNIVNTLHHMRGNDGLPKMSHKTYRFFLDYLIETYGKQAWKLIREPYTWYVMSLLNRIPIKDSITHGENYIGIFRKLSDIINVEGLHGEAVINHPDIASSIASLENLPTEDSLIPRRNTLNPEFMINDLYRDLSGRLKHIISTENLNAVSLSQHPDIRRIINLIRYYYKDSELPDERYKSLENLLKYIIETYGKTGGVILKEPYSWYILSLLSSVSLNDSNLSGIDYKEIIKKLYELITKDKSDSKAIIGDPYLARMVRVLRESEESFRQRSESRLPKTVYESLRTKLRSILDTTGLNTELILDEPSIHLFLKTFGRSFGELDFSNINTTRFEHYIKYVLKTYGKSAKEILYEPYTWYIIGLLSKAPLDAFLPKEIEYKTVFRTLNDIINTEGEHGENIFNNPYISYVINTLKRVIHFQHYNFNYLRKTLTDVISTSQMDGRAMINDPLIWYVIKSVERRMGDDGLSNVNRNSLSAYLNYLMKTYGKGTELILKEPYTWYMLSLMSRTPFNRLPDGVDYQRVFSIINDIVHSEYKNNEDIISHPYIHYTIDTLRRPREAKFTLESRSDIPITNLSALYETSEYRMLQEYESIKSKLKGTISEKGLEPDSLIRDSALWDLLDAFHRFIGFPVTRKWYVNDKSLKYYLTYIIKTYGKSAENILREPFVWCIMRLMSVGPVQNYLPSDVDYTRVFSLLNNQINNEKKPFTEIMRHPYIIYTIDSLIRRQIEFLYPSKSFINGFPDSQLFPRPTYSFGTHPYPTTDLFGIDTIKIYPNDKVHQIYHEILIDILQRCGPNADKILNDPEFRDFIESFRQFDSGFGLLPRNNDSFKYYLNYILATFGGTSDGILTEPYTWYIMKLMSVRPIDDIRNANYRKVFGTIDDLINAKGKTADDILQNPLIRRTIQSLHFQFNPDFSTFHKKLFHLYPSNIEYTNHRKILMNIINRAGIDPKEILKYSEIWHLIRDFQRYDGTLPPVNDESLKYYLNYIVTTYGTASEESLKEPLVWYILRLISSATVASVRAIDVDYHELFGNLNELINSDGVHGDAIIETPYIRHTITLLHQINGPFLPFDTHDTRPYVDNPSWDVSDLRIYPTRIQYLTDYKKLNDMMNRRGLKSRKIVEDSSLFEVFNNFETSSGLPQLDTDSLNYFLNYLINTYGSRAKNLLTEPYVWYVLRLMSGGPVQSYLPLDVDYQRVFEVIDRMLNDDKKSADQIINHPYIRDAIHSLRRGRNIDIPTSPSHPKYDLNIFKPFSPKLQSFFQIYPSPYEYNMNRKKLIDVIEEVGLKPEPILNDPRLGDIIASFQLYDKAFTSPELNKDRLNAFLRYVLDEYRERAENILKEPYSWYIMTLMSGNRFVHPLIDYKTIFHILNEQINTRGLRGEKILKHPYISQTINYLKPPRSETFAQSPFLSPAFTPDNDYYNTYFSSAEHDYYRKRLSDILDRNGLRSENILKDVELSDVFNKLHNRDGNVLPLARASLKYYLDYAIKNYGRRAVEILKEPYTWYIIKLMSATRPQDVNYRLVFSLLNELINIHGIRGNDVIRHPILMRFIQSLLGTGRLPFNNDGRFVSSYPYPTWNLLKTVNREPFDYRTYHRKLSEILERSGLDTEAILKESDLKDVVNAVRRSRGDYGLTLMDKKVLTTYLNFLIKKFDRAAETILKEPYTWYILNLLDRSRMDGELPVGIDHEDILNKLNEYINIDGIHGEEILNRPETKYTIDYLLRISDSGSHPPGAVDPTLFYDMLNELLNLRGDKRLREHYIWYIVNALRRSTGDGPFPTVNYKIFNDLLDYLINKYGRDAEELLREPYTWYILSLLSDGSVTRLMKNGRLPAGIDYKTFYNLINYLIKTHGKNAEEVLKEPYVWYLMNTLKNGSTPVRYGKNIHQVEELTNLDGTQYLVYSTFNKTWVHPTLLHGQHFQTDDRLSTGGYGKYENKLLELMDAIINGISGKNSQGHDAKVQVVPGGGVMVDQMSGSSSLNETALQGSMSGADLNGSGNVSVETNEQRIQHAPGADIAIMPGFSTDGNDRTISHTVTYTTKIKGSANIVPTYKIDIKDGGGALTSTRKTVTEAVSESGESGSSTTTVLGGSGGGGGSGSIVTVSNSNGGSSSSAGGGGSGSTIITLGGGNAKDGGGSSSSVVTVVGGGGTESGNGGSWVISDGDGGTSATSSSSTITLGGPTGEIKTFTIRGSSNNSETTRN